MSDFSDIPRKPGRPRVVFDNDTERHCNKCNTTKSVDFFQKNKKVSGGYNRWCKSCNYQANLALARQRKLEGVKYKGGFCQKCGGEFPMCVYEFHHIDPDSKGDKDPSKMARSSKEKFFAELDKCVLLCANCHRLTHAEMRED